MNMSDDADTLRVGPGHPVKLPGFAANAPKSLKKLSEKDPEVGKYINSLVND